MNSIKRKLLILFESLLPTIKNTVLFISFTGLYNDNPKQISIHLHKKYPDVRQIWLQEDNSKEQIPDYAFVVRPGSFDYIKYVFRAQVVIDNYNGCRTAKVFGAPSFINNIKGNIKIRKRKNQLNISTWHGTTLKHIAYDDPNANQNEVFFTTSNYILSGCELTEKALISSMRNQIPVMRYGTPRNDLLVSGESDSKLLKTKLGIPSKCKVVLFAPTFRNELQLSGIEQMRSIDFQTLFNVLHEKFGGEWVFVFRVHNLVVSHIDDTIIPFEFKNRIINGNKCDDMLDYMICSDILLTDYSSSMFDYSLTGKPCFLFTPDLSHYANEERGFYLQIDQLPYPVAETFEQLLHNIEQFDEEQYLNNNADFLEYIKNYEDGMASDRVVEDIISFIKNSQ